MKTIGFVFNTVDQRRGFSRFLLASCAIVSVFALLLPAQGCKSKKQELQHGSGQIASAQEKEQQNRDLISQVVKAIEAQERYPDATYLRDALGRLNSWLAERPESADFVPDPEYDEQSKKITELVAAVKKADELMKLFSDESKSVEEKDCDELQSTMESLKAQFESLSEELSSNTLKAYGIFVDEILEKLRSAREFQFADPTESFQTQIRQFVEAPNYAIFNFSVLRVGLEDYNRLLKIDSKVFLPQDVDYLRSVVWFRDVFNWAKGAKQDDMTIVRKIFDWTVKNVVLAEPLPGPAGPVAQLEWQTLLLGQGSPMDRAIVFIELLRQNRLDAFVVRPDGKLADDFPVVVGVRLDSEVFLFDMARGLPFASSADDAIVLDEKDGLVVNKVATLKEVVADDSILRKFDLESFPCNASSKDFENAVAYVPSTPFHVSARMIPMEQEFSDKVNTVLSTPFDVQKERIAAIEGIADVRRLQEANAPILEQTIFPDESELVTRIFMTHMESSGNLEIEGTSEEGSKASDIDDYTGDSSDFSGNVSGKKSAVVAPLWTGKILYLRGMFVNDDGAAHWLLQGRVSERVLKNMESSVQKSVSEYLKQYMEWAASQNQQPSDDELRQLASQAALSFQLEIATKRYIKVLTSYNLALLSEASGSDSAAMDRLNDDSLRLRRQVNELQPGDEFRNAANYLRARLLEKQGAWPTAVARLRACWDRGSHIRANWIAKLAGLPELDPTVNAPAQNEPATETPAESEPATEAPAQSEPATETPAESEPATEAPAESEPATETPAESEPATETPAQSEPATEAPAQSEPAAEAPAESEPATEAPAQSEPAAEAPAESEPAAESPAQ